MNCSEVAADQPGISPGIPLLQGWGDVKIYADLDAKEEARVSAAQWALDIIAITETLAELDRYREALPNPGRLELLADWFDMKFPNDPMPEVQTDLRKWAKGIRDAIADEEVPERDQV